VARPRRLLLLHPGTLYGGSWAGAQPLKAALVALYSYLRAHDVDVQVLDLQTELGNPTPEQVEAYVARGVELLEPFDFDVLGISCWSSLEYLAAVDFATRVRARRPQTLIVVGGYHPSARPVDFTYAGSPFDVVVTGEGELVLLELLRDGPAAGGGPVRVVTGTPLPMDRLYFDLEGYPYLTERPANVGVYLSRGCPHRCTFCMEASKGRGWRHLSVEDSLEAVRRARGYNPNVIVFFDACFGHQKAWRHDFLHGLAAMKVDVPLWAETRIDRTGADDLDLFERCGFYLQFGVETMSPRMAEIMRKATNGEKYVRIADETLLEVNRRQILSKTFLIFNHPGDSRELAEETVSYFERFVSEHEKVTVIVNVMKYQHFVGSDVDVRRAHYEHTYGARFSHPDWYRERGAQLDLAQDNLASSGFTDVDDYVQRIKALQPQLIRKMPAAKQLQFLQHLHHWG
jgi:radical SAM superfamily enzyme YgiQ (UPF0313 family)